MMIDEDKSNIIFYTSFYLERKTNPELRRQTRAKWKAIHLGDAAASKSGLVDAAVICRRKHLNE
jgi:hypothetical protein